MNGEWACLPCSLVTDLRKYKPMIIIIFANGFYVEEFFLTRYCITAIVPPSARIKYAPFPFLLVTDLRKYESFDRIAILYSHRFCLRDAADGKAPSSIRVCHQSPHLLTDEGQRRGILWPLMRRRRWPITTAINVYCGFVFNYLALRAPLDFVCVSGDRSSNKMILIIIGVPPV